MSPIFLEKGDLFAEEGEVAVEHVVGGGEGALFVVEDAELFLLEEGADLRLAVEVVA